MYISLYVSKKYRLVSVFFFAILFSSSAYSGLGTLAIKNLPDADIEDSPVCFDQATGQLGQCESNTLILFDNYLTPASVTRKVWVRTNITDGEIRTDTCDNMVWEYARSATPGGTQIDITERYTRNDGTLCGVERERIRTADGAYLVSTEMLEGQWADHNGPYKTTYEPPFHVRPAATAMGLTYGDGTTATRYYPSYQGGDPLTLSLIHMEKRVIIGIEDITVPAGTFIDCLKEFGTRASTTQANEYRIRWLCPGVGVAKSIRAYDQTDSPRSSRISELESISYQ